MSTSASMSASTGSTSRRCPTTAMAAGAGLNTASGTCIATAVDIIVGAVVVLPLFLLDFLILLVLGVRAVLRFLFFRNPPSSVDQTECKSHLVFGRAFVSRRSPVSAAKN